MVEAVTRAAYAAATAPVVPSQPQHVNQQPVREIVGETTEIVLHEVGEIELDGEGEEEIDEEYEEEDYDDEAYAVDGEETYRSSLSPDVNSNPISCSNETDLLEPVRTSRKRSSDELEGEDGADGSSASTYDSGDSVSSMHRRHSRPDGTPPKRARLGDQATDTVVEDSSSAFIGPVLPVSQNMASVTAADATLVSVPTPTPTIKRAKKRSSEELTVDDDENAGNGAGTGMPTVSSKRAKVDLERPRSLSLASSTPGAAVATGGVVDRTMDRNRRRTIALDDK